MTKRLDGKREDFHFTLMRLYDFWLQGIGARP